MSSFFGFEAVIFYVHFHVIYLAAWFFLLSALSMYVHFKYSVLSWPNYLLSFVFGYILLACHFLIYGFQPLAYDFPVTGIAFSAAGIFVLFISLCFIFLLCGDYFGAKGDKD